MVSMRPARFKISGLDDGRWLHEAFVVTVGLLHHPRPALHLGKSTTEPICLALSWWAEPRPGKHKVRKSKHEDLHVCRSDLHTDDALFLHLGCLEGKTDQGRIDDRVAEHRMHMIFDGL
jgi:hypothetical protein